MTYETPIGANTFAYCMNNPVNMTDDGGETALAIGVVILSSTIGGGVLGAFFEVCKGGDWKKGAVVGSAYGFTSAVVGVTATSSIIVATLYGFTGGALIETGSQLYDQSKNTGTMDMTSLDGLSIVDSGLMTAVSASIPAVGKPSLKNWSFSDALVTSALWNECSTALSSIEFIAESVVDVFRGRR